MKKIMFSLAALLSVQAFASNHFALIISKNDANYEIVKPNDNNGGNEDNTVYLDCALSENSTSYKWFQAVQRGDVTVSGLGYDLTTCTFMEGESVTVHKAIELDSQELPIANNGSLTNFIVSAAQIDEIKLGDVKITGSLNIDGYQNTKLDLSTVLLNENQDHPSNTTSINIKNTNIDNLVIQKNNASILLNSVVIENNLNLKTFSIQGIIGTGVVQIINNSSTTSINLSDLVMCMSKPEIYGNGSAIINTGACTHNSTPLPPAA